MSKLSFVELDEALKRFLSTYIRPSGARDEERDRLWAQGLEADRATLERAVLALSDADPSAVMKACVVLGAARFGEAVPTLLAKLDEGNALLTSAFVWALGEIGDLRAVRPLERFFARGVCREGIAEAFAKIGDLDPVSHLALLMEEGETRTRLYLVGALASLLAAHAGTSALEEYAGLAPRLERVLGSDPFPPIRVLAASALAAVGRRFTEGELRTLVEASLAQEQLSPLESFFSRKR